jgi:hypothetical protein
LQDRDEIDNEMGLVKSKLRDSMVNGDKPDKIKKYQKAL